MGAARRGVSTVVERIDPGVLADLIIKATALQEMTNASLREKRSPYRISEVGITASIPPGVTFAISRIDDIEETLTGGDVSSEELVEEHAETGRGGHRARRHDPRARSSSPRSGRRSRTRSPRTSTSL